MPQFEFANFLPQMAWLVLAFAILYFGIVRATLPRLGRTIDARQSQVSGDLGVAERAKHDADAMRADYEASVASAQEAARARLGDVRAAAARSQEERLAQANQTLAARAESAEAALAAARTRAVGEIESVAADAAADIVQKLTGARPAPAEAADAARVALA